MSGPTQAPGGTPGGSGSPRRDDDRRASGDHPSGGQRDADRDGHRDANRGSQGDGQKESSSGTRGHGGDSSSGGDHISRWEWVTAITGLLLVLGAIGVMLWEGVARDDLPPAFDMQVDSTFTRADGFHVLFRAHNNGDVTAAEVRVRALLMRGDSAVQQEDVTFDYLPPRSTRRGAIIFPSRPPGTTIELRPLGYHQP